MAEKSENGDPSLFLFSQQIKGLWKVSAPSHFSMLGSILVERNDLRSFRGRHPPPISPQSTQLPIPAYSGCATRPEYAFTIEINKKSGKRCLLKDERNIYSGIIKIRKVHFQMEHRNIYICHLLVRRPPSIGYRTNKLSPSALAHCTLFSMGMFNNQTC